MREMEPAAARAPYQVCVGNHESHYNFSAYRNRFAMSGTAGSSEDGPQGPRPVNNLWHTFAYGGVRFVAFSTEHEYSQSSDQLLWLERTLETVSTKEERALRPWIVVFGHKPVYCSTNDFYDCHIGGPKKIGPAVEPLLRKYGVDLFLAGHLHNYERTWPVYNGTVLRRNYTWDGEGSGSAKGTTHVVIGMAGDSEGLTDSWDTPTPTWSAKHAANLGWARVSALNSSVLHFEYVASASGTVLDSFTLRKPAVHAGAL